MLVYNLELLKGSFSWPCGCADWIFDGGERMSYAEDDHLHAIGAYVVIHIEE